MPQTKQEPEDEADRFIRLAQEAAASDIDAYYVRRGEQVGEWLRAAYRSMRPDDEEMPLEVALHVLLALVHSKRERGLW